MEDTPCIGSLLCEISSENEKRLLEGKKFKINLIGFGDKFELIKVGSGLSDEARLTKDFIGKTINISYTEISQNQEGHFSLRHPRFNYIRKEI